MEPMIEIRHLTKDYGQGRGVFDVSFSVEKGEVFGFLGPNGAGKSTTIRHLMGFSIPDEGETRIKGKNSTQERDVIMKGVSYIPGEIALPNALKGKEVLKIQCALKGVKDKSRLNRLKEIFELDDSLYCKEMSLGMKRKMAIVIAFMSDPDVIIMDEPSSGLDPEMQKRFIHLILEEKKRGKTILLSSHIFSEVDSCCDRIAIIKDGKLVSTFLANDLKHKVRKQYLVHYEFERLRDKAVTLLRGAKFTVQLNEKDPLTLLVDVNDDEVNSFLRILPKDFVSFEEKKETLEEYFMSFYKEDLTYGGIQK